MLMSDNGFVGDTDVHDALPGASCAFGYREGTSAAPAVLTLGERTVHRFTAGHAARHRVGVSPDGTWIVVAVIVLRGDRAAETVDVKVFPVPPNPCELEVRGLAASE
jgi:hypothetical protein